jgi:hypothetical protein
MWGGLSWQQPLFQAPVGADGFGITVSYWRDEPSNYDSARSASYSANPSAAQTDEIPSADFRANRIAFTTHENKFKFPESPIPATPQRRFRPIFRPAASAFPGRAW